MNKKVPEIVQIREGQVDDGVIGKFVTAITVNGKPRERVTYFPIKSVIESALVQGAKIEDL